MNISYAQSFGTEFLRNLDDFIGQYWKQMKCRDVYQIYHQFWNDLKDFRGTSTNFTGLTELILFRFITHQLGGAFKKQVINKDVAEFTNDRFTVRQCLSVPELKCRPDITIWESDRMVGVIQIKAFLTNGWKTFQDEVTVLGMLREKYNLDLGTLIIIYDTYSMPKQLKISNHPYIFLKDNDTLLHIAIEKHIPKLAGF
jgi:hypothetical protein